MVFSTAIPASPISSPAKGLWMVIAGLYALLATLCILKDLLWVPLLLAALPMGVGLVLARGYYLPLIFIAAKMLLDSWPGFAYRSIGFGLSIVDAVSLLTLACLGGYLLLRRQFSADAVTLGTVALLATNLTTVAYHGDYLSAFDVISKWLFFLAVYTFMINHLDEARKKRLLLVMSLIVVYPLANLMVAVFAGAGQLHMGSVRYAGTYVHPKILGEYLLFTIPAILFLMGGCARPLRKTALRTLLIGLHAGLFFTGYRTLWIALGLLWLVHILGARRNKLRMLFGAAAAVVIIGALSPVASVVMQKFDSLGPLVRGEVDLLGATHFFDDLMSGRIGIWRLSLRAFLQSPVVEILLGLGIGFTAQLTTFYMHNEYLSALVETGFLGLMALLVWLGIVAWQSLRPLGEGGEWQRLLRIAFFPMAILAVGTMPFRSVNVMSYLAIYTAFVVHGTRASAKPAESRPPTAPPWGDHPPLGSRFMRFAPPRYQP